MGWLSSRICVRAVLVPTALSILLLAARGAPAVAATTSVGNWSVVTGTNYGMASTGSTSGGELGIVCDASMGSCLFFLDSSSMCTNGASYPILLNGPSGAFDLVATCRVVKIGAANPIDTLVLSPYSAVQSALKSDGQIVGLAEPMTSGAFRVYRFSTTGAADASRVVAAAANSPDGDQTM